MKSRKEIITAVLLGVIFPVIFMSNFQTNRKTVKQGAPVDVIMGDNIVRMDIEDYLVGVLLGEMPGNFEIEALKAQAVAARTFALYNMEKGIKHIEADVCTSAACCQAYISPDEYISFGGDSATVLKMYEAVNQTKGQALFYNGALIEATYFSSSGGKTEDAQAVWGVSVPYLQSVESGEGDMEYTVEISKDRFCKSLGLQKGEVYIDTPVYTNGGGIAAVYINEKKFSGMELRQMLGLRSTKITFFIGKENIKITTKGYGHGVGLSQYGADAMAKNGHDYKQILIHYYSDVAVQLYIMDMN